MSNCIFFKIILILIVILYISFFINTDITFIIIWRIIISLVLVSFLYFPWWTFRRRSILWSAFRPNRSIPLLSSFSRWIFRPFYPFVLLLVSNLLILFILTLKLYNVVLRLSVMTLNCSCYFCKIASWSALATSVKLFSAIIFLFLPNYLIKYLTSLYKLLPTFFFCWKGYTACPDSIWGFLEWTHAKISWMVHALSIAYFLWKYVQRNIQTSNPV